MQKSSKVVNSMLNRFTGLLCTFPIAAIILIGGSIASNICAGSETVLSIDDALVGSASAAVEQSVPFIIEKGDWWIEEKDCASCHRVGNMLWSLSEVADAGFTVGDNLDELSKWAVDQLLATDSDGISTAAKNEEGAAQLLLSGSDLTRSQVQELSQVLIDNQRLDGTWLPNGQLPSQKRNKDETRDVSTAWIVLALTNLQDDLLEELKNSRDEAVERAVSALRERKSAVSTEWYVVSLLVSDALGDTVWQERSRKQLLEAKRNDGGWGWLIEDESDALATGLAMYALVSTDSAKPVGLANTVDYLVSTQLPNGSWAVNGTKKAKKNLHQETATYWGTTWASQALAAWVAAENRRSRILGGP